MNMVMKSRILFFESVTSCSSVCSSCCFGRDFYFCLQCVTETFFEHRCVFTKLQELRSRAKQGILFFTAAHSVLRYDPMCMCGCCILQHSLLFVARTIHIAVTFPLLIIIIIIIIIIFIYCNWVVTRWQWLFYM